MADRYARWAFDASRHEHGRLALLTFCQAVHSTSGVAYALMLRGMVDSAVAGDAQGLLRWTAGTVALVLFQLTLRTLMRGLDERCRAGLENTFKGRLFGALLHGDVGRVAAIHSAEWMNRLTNDAKLVADGCTDIIPSVVGMTCRLIGALAVLLWLDPRLAVVIVPGGTAVILLTWLFRRVLRRLHKTIQEADGRLRVFVQERLGALLTIRSFAVEEQALEGANELMDEHFAVRMRRNRFSNLCNVGFGLAMNGAQLGTIIWCCYGILTHTMSFGTLTAMAQLVGQVQAPLASMTGYLPRWFALLASAERLAEAETLADSPCDALPLSAVLNRYDNELAAIALTDVSYTYWPSTEDVASLSKQDVPPALEHLSMEVRKEEFLALTGHSGCGKSTALRLLMGSSDPDEGERVMLLRDGSRTTLTAAWRRLFAYVPQGNRLMGGTIREAVSLADPQASGDDERIWWALRRSCADEFVAELPDGLDTILGERGAGLSEGQMQRLAIARAVFSGSPMLLLDEATSSLDAATESRLLQSLRGVEGRTLVVVTHRNAALTMCDRVLHFSEEGVVEQ